MKSAFKKLNDELFSNSTIKMEKLAVIRGGKNCKVRTIHGDHTHSDTISNDDDIKVVTSGTVNA
jgi:hypothetical protein